MSDFAYYAGGKLVHLKAAGVRGLTAPRPEGPH